MKGCHTVSDIVEAVTVAHVAGNVTGQPVKPLYTAQLDVRFR